METKLGIDNDEWRLNYRTLEMSVLHKISIALVKRDTVKKLLNEILQILHKEMGLTRGTFTLRQNNLLFIEASHGMSEAEINRGVYRIGEGVTGQVAAHAKSRIIYDITESMEFLNRTKTRVAEKNIAFICVPIIHQEQVIGTLSIDRKVSIETNLRRDLSLLETISNIVADAVSVLYLHNQEKEKLLQENKLLKLELSEKSSCKSILGKCNAMRKVMNTIMQVSDTNSPVLIRGETGTGKKLVAQTIASLGKKKKFLSINCVAMQESVLERELFGYENGKSQKSIGLIESANRGTLFLDKIGDMGIAIQSKLLRFLQEKSFYRVNGKKPVRSDVRIIVASGKNLEELVREKKFVEDLYHRLNVVSINLPALRDRRSDIILLADHFLEKFKKRYNKKIIRISNPAISMFMSYYWHGNVRELENCIESAVLTTRDNVIHGYDLPPSLQTALSTNTSKLCPDSEVDFVAMVKSFERELITEALKIHKGNATAAAKHLGISQRMINYKIKNLNLVAVNFKAKIPRRKKA